MVSKQWKRSEARVAELLGGQRIYRGNDFSESKPDVIAPFGLIPNKDGTILAECKYSINQPWITNKTLVKKYIDPKLGMFWAASKDYERIFLFFHLEKHSSLEFVRAIAKAKKQKLSDIKAHCDLNKEVKGYLLDYYNQSEGYCDCDFVKNNNHGEPYIPIVCLSKKSYTTRLAFVDRQYLSHF